jgi:hypothetical protein
MNEAVAISVERMMTFCYFVEMETEYRPLSESALPPNLTRFGAMVFQSASFLYSLFDENRSSTNLLKVWKGIDHPFEDELKAFERKLVPFKDDLRKTRHRIGFHGNLARNNEREGLNLFINIDNPRVSEFVRLLWEMRNLAVKMIDWYIRKKFGESENANKLLSAFVTELKGYEVTKKQLLITAKSSTP